MVLVIAVLNDGTIMTISKDRVKPSPIPGSWKLTEIFATGVVLGAYLALMTVIFFWLAYETNFFPNTFGVKDFNSNHRNMSDKAESKELTAMLASAVYLQVSTISHALIFRDSISGMVFHREARSFACCCIFYCSTGGVDYIGVCHVGTSRNLEDRMGVDRGDLVV